MIIEGQKIDDVLYGVSKALLNAPEYSPRGMRTKELIKPQLITLDITDPIIKNPARKFSDKYLNAEMNWYLSGQRNIKNIKDYASMWERIADENDEVNSNYGEIVFYQKMDKYNGTQFEWVVDSLLKDKDSRQALINFNQPKHKYENNKDFVCTVATQYLIRNNELISTTDMRSNDLIYGFSYDFPFFAYLQTEIFNSLKEKYPDLKLGKNIHSSTSLHVYEKHFKMLENIVKEYEDSRI